MEIRQLRAFTAIAESGTFTAGALRVHITQAAISMQIKQMELELGAPLFVRAPRRVFLTEAGEALLERARRILREHDAAVAEIAELAGAERGRLRIGSASAMVSADPLPQILKELRQRHPQAEIAIVSGTSEALVRQILAGELDMAFVSLPVEARGIQTEVLSRDELIAIASPKHKLAKQRVISVFTLAGEKLILGERGGNTRRLIDGLFEEAGVQPVVAMELSRLAAIKRMAEEEMGVGIVPSNSAREEVAAGRLVAWWIEGAQINWELGLAKLAGDYDSPICQTFTNLCRLHFDADAKKPALRQKTKPTQEKRKRAAHAR
jgi:DNA-binding transcriptional LysR family regulator